MTACGRVSPSKRKPAKPALKRKPKRKPKPAPPRTPVVKRHAFPDETSTCTLCGVHRRLVRDEADRALYLYSHAKGADAIWSSFRPGCVVVG
jgi:hypothetical protein